MKRNYFILIGTLFLLLAVCVKKMEDQKRFFGFTEKNQKGITVLQVKSNARFLAFTGEITLTDNEVEFRLLNKTRAFYAVRFHSIGAVSCNRTFCNHAGFRKINRTSFDWLFALFLIFFAVRGGLGYENINATKSPK